MPSISAFGLAGVADEEVAERQDLRLAQVLERLAAHLDGVALAHGLQEPRLVRLDADHEHEEPGLLHLLDEGGVLPEGVDADFAGVQVPDVALDQEVADPLHPLQVVGEVGVDDVDDRGVGLGQFRHHVLRRPGRPRLDLAEDVLAPLAERADHRAPDAGDDVVALQGQPRVLVAADRAVEVEVRDVDRAAVGVLRRVRRRWPAVPSRAAARRIRPRLPAEPEARHALRRAALAPVRAAMSSP